MHPTLYEQLGGERKLRQVIDRFVDRVVADVMIGFFFRRVNVARLKELEYQHAAAFLGAPIAYTGRAMGDVHRRHGIQGGQFARRKTILEEVLREEQVPEAIVAAWLSHQDSLRGDITRAVGDGCDMGGSRGP